MSEPSPGSLLIESERRTARMQTSLVVEEGRRSGNAGDASRYRPEALYSLDASRFIGVSFVVILLQFPVDLRGPTHNTDAQNIA